MLRTDTVHAPLLELLTRLQAVSSLQTFRLVGGTALALQLGHRRSIDLDLFGTLPGPMEHFALTKQLERIGTFIELNRTQSILTCTLDGMKVDIVNYPYPWLEEPLVVDQFRLARMKDIAAMKLAAITARGSRKDFIDLYLLLDHYPLEEMIGFFERKFTGGSRYLVLKSLTWFADAESEPMPIMCVPCDWHRVVERLSLEVARVATQP